MRKLENSFSIIMPYYNRPEQMYYSLKSIINSYYGKIEIIIVDDGSEVPYSALRVFRHWNDISCNDIPIKIVTLPRSQKWWSNPCIPFNIGAMLAQNEVLVLQSPEVVHLGNPLEYVDRNIDKSSYISMPCAFITKSQWEGLTRNSYPNSDDMEEMLYNIRAEWTGQWYNHVLIRPVAFHFLSALLTRNFHRIGGFDRDFARGYCFEDTEFIERVRKQFTVLIPNEDRGFGVHLWHPRASIAKGGDSNWLRNKTLYESITGKKFVQT